MSQNRHTVEITLTADKAYNVPKVAAAIALALDEPDGAARQLEVERIDVSYLEEVEA